MEILNIILLVMAAFLLGSFPFSLWIGRIFLNKDIRNYGDGNPGATNVFRAGGKITGCLAVLLDVCKGIPFVYLAHAIFYLPGIAMTVIAMSAIAGHAFSPLLRFKGGKSVAIASGTLIGLLPYSTMIIPFTAFICMGAFFIADDSWAIMVAPAGSIVYLVATGAESWQLLLMAGILLLLSIKHHRELKSIPNLKIRPLEWARELRYKI